jgi:type IV pilus assembly protein PilM
MELPDFFALDIGSHSIKVAQVKRFSEGKARLEHIGSVETEYGLLENSTDEGIKRLAAQVKAAKESAGIKTPNCVAAVPEAPIFSRLLTIPEVEDAKLEESIHWELKPLIPVPLTDVDIAFLEIGEKEVSGQKMLDIYVVAAPKTLTQRFQKLAEAAGITLLALETESLANTRAITFNVQTEKDIMIFDFGAYGTDLVIARDSVPVFAQSISTGSDALTKAIAADYGVDLAEAEKYKRTFGLKFDQGDGKIARSIEPLMQILVNEMARTMTYFKQRIGETGATKIYMCGDAAKLPGLPEYFTAKLGLTSVLVDPVSKLEIADSAKKDLQQLSTVGFSVVVGLGLKEN